MKPAEVESLLQIEDSSPEAWCDVFRRLIINKNKLCPPGTAEIVCHALLKKVEDIGYEDKDSIWKIICICTINLWEDTIYFHIQDNYQIPYSFYLPLCEPGDPTHPFYKYSVGAFMISRLLLHSLRKSEVKATKLLLNYGYLHSDIYDLMAEAINTTSFLRAFAPELPGHVNTPECSAEFSERLKLLNRLGFTNVRGCDSLRVYQRGFPRIMLAAASLLVLKYLDSNAEQYVQCLGLYFRGVPDPLVEADEVEELLRFFLFDVPKDYVEGLLQEFKRLYPESEGPYRPRSLKHLCRCAIRQKLCDRSKVLPVLLDDLRLPRSLKKYIIGDL